MVEIFRRRGHKIIYSKKWISWTVVLAKLTTNALHYSDVIETTMASQIASLTIVYSTVYSGPDQRKHQSSVSYEFLAQRASNAETVSIWWRHHEYPLHWFRSHYKLRLQKGYKNAEAYRVAFYYDARHSRFVWSMWHFVAANTIIYKLYSHTNPSV